MKKNVKNIILRLLLILMVSSTLLSCEREIDRIRKANDDRPIMSARSNENETLETTVEIETETEIETIIESATESETTGIEETTADKEIYAFDLESAKARREERRRKIENEGDPNSIEEIEIRMDDTFLYATYSVIYEGSAKLYKVGKNVPNYKGKTIAINAGHGTKNGELYKTFSHPDFSPKVAGGTTTEGNVLSFAISEGTRFLDGGREDEANLMIAILLKDKLLKDGYSVLMIREDNNSSLDNIARCVIANEYSDAHVAIHFDSTTNDKGIFYVIPKNYGNYLNMEPLKSNYDNIIKLGQSIIEAYRSLEMKIWKSSGTLDGDLTLFSYSVVPCVNIELGDRATVFTEEKINKLVDGLKLGIDMFFNDESQSE